jgi:ligand-binding sensor domain-containing protein/serine phosphatase RsbU (regulator of sigma subunit)
MRLLFPLRNFMYFLFLVIPSLAWSQDEETKFEDPEEMSFESIPAEQGLSNKAIPAIVEDKSGYLWFATQEGLNKYNGYEFKVYQNDPSDSTTISNNNIFSLIQDTDGYMWLGTENGGLNRFDPISGTAIRFIHDENNPKSICSNNVYSILESKNGYLWIGTWEAGIDVLNRKTGEIISRYKHDPKDENSVAAGGIWNIHEDSEGLIWISTWGGGLDRMDPKTGAFTHFKHDANNPSSISNDIVGPIYEDQNGKIWIATWGGGLNRFDRRTETFKSFMFDAKDPKSIGSNLVWPIVEDENGYLLIGTYGSGINKFNPRTETFKRYPHDAGNPNSLNHNDVWSLHIDRSHILWVGTEGGGVSKYVNIKKEVDIYTFDPGNPLSLGHNSVRAIQEDKSGMIWIGTWDGGLDCFDRVNGKITNYKNDPGDGNNTGLNKIKAILSDKNGRLWIGTYRGGLAEFDKTKHTFSYYTHVSGDIKTISDDYVYSLAEDQQGNLWVGTLNGLNIFDRETNQFTRFKNEPSNLKSISNNTINSIFCDNKGVVWAGTDLGLNRYDATTKTFTRFLHDPKDSTSLSHSTVYTLYQDKSGIFWVGTRDGLDKFLPRKGFEHLSSKDGLANNTIMAIQEDGEGQLLISTKNGISRFNKNTRTFINYDMSDGIAGRQFFPNSSYKTKDGKIYFGGTEGMNAFYPDRIQNNPYVPIVLISGIKKFGKEMKFDKAISEIKELELPYNQNSLTFEFVALSYANSEENQYAYKLEGVDKDWKYGSNIRTAHYSNLHPGTYTFKVKASNDDGLWNLKGATIRIVINPPFWKTLWFYSLCVLAGILLVFAFIKSREKKLVREKKILERKVDQRTAEVMMQKEIVETQNKEIKDSILYAKRIQEAILPSQEEIRKAFPDSFVLFKPRDIVSGDFYWFSEKNGKLIIAVADCTGHGVPGAFMSMIGNTLLNEIVNEKEVIEPYHILFQLRENIIKCLKQTGAEGENKDGMDIALCVFDRNNLHLEFAGANNPLYLVNEEELLEIKGDKQPIGIYAGETKPFTNHLKVLKKGDCVYIASDGYADQFGGTNGKKFKYKQMKDLLVSSKNMSMQQQKVVLENNIEQWRGNLEQVDDILVVGFRV